MWAGSTLSFHDTNPLRVGQLAKVETRMAHVESKQSMSRGNIIFVELERKISNQAGVSAIETRKLAYFRDPLDPSKAKEIKGTPTFLSSRSNRSKAPTDTQFQRKHRATEILLFRYSALTYNCHRIHYDTPYATKIEGYPGILGIHKSVLLLMRPILVHGPLTATFLLDLVRRQYPSRFVKKFDYKGNFKMSV